MQSLRNCAKILARRPGPNTAGTTLAPKLSPGSRERRPLSRSRRGCRHCRTPGRLAPLHALGCLGHLP
eukprot:4602597-Pyramimonas_sp.AAC.1